MTRPATSDERLLTISQICAFLQVSRSTIEKAVGNGLPAIDVGRHHPDRRPKRSLRFLLPEVIEWFRTGRNGGTR